MLLCLRVYSHHAAWARAPADVLKDVLAGEDTAMVSRQAQLQWLTEFMVFVGGNQAALQAYPHLVFQFAINQVRGPRCGPLPMRAAWGARRVRALRL